jgi:hypothetical protein
MTRPDPVEPLPPACSLEESHRMRGQKPKAAGGLICHRLLSDFGKQPEPISQRPSAAGAMQLRDQRCRRSQGHAAQSCRQPCHVLTLQAGPRGNCCRCEADPQDASPKAHLLCDHGHGRALVQQPQLAVLVLHVARVAVDAAVQHGAVEVAHLAPAGSTVAVASGGQQTAWTAGFYTGVHTRLQFALQCASKCMWQTTARPGAVPINARGPSSAPGCRCSGRNRPSR